MVSLGPDVPPVRRAPMPLARHEGPWPTPGAKDDLCLGARLTICLELGRTIAQAFRTQTSLCRNSNRSLFAGGNSAGKKFGEAGDWGGIFGVTGRFRAAETALSRVPTAKPRNVKDYTDGARKLELRRSAWWGW
jgi:hypothetical protein